MSTEEKDPYNEKIGSYNLDYNAGDSVPNEKSYAPFSNDGSYRTVKYGTDQLNGAKPEAINTVNSTPQEPTTQQLKEERDRAYEAINNLSGSNDIEI